MLMINKKNCVLLLCNIKSAYKVENIQIFQENIPLFIELTTKLLAKKHILCSIKAKTHILQNHFGEYKPAFVYILNDSENYCLFLYTC